MMALSRGSPTEARPRWFVDEEEGKICVGPLRPR